MGSRPDAKREEIASGKHKTSDGLCGKTQFQLYREVETLLANQVRPLLKIHGGGIDLLDVTAEGRVSLEFQGACRGCALKSVTYALAVRQRLLQLPGVREVVVGGVRLSESALRRVEHFYSGYSFWADG